MRTYGATTPLSVVKCFMKALHTQETHQEKADRLGYHVVRFDPMRDNLPQVLASPRDNARHEPYDEHREYLSQPLITRDVRKREGFGLHDWMNVLYQSNRGPPVPNPVRVPERLSRVKESEL